LLDNTRFCSYLIFFQETLVLKTPYYMAEFFLEIGSEELPSGYVQLALDYMHKELASFFSKNRIDAKFF